MTPKVRVDGIDVSIIRALQKDARVNFADIARECDVSTDTISKRFRKMKRAGIIRGTTILLNPKSFGYDCVASLCVGVSYPHLKEVVESALKDSKGGKITLEHGGYPYSNRDLEILLEVHEELMDKFQSQLEHIKKRVDER